VSEYEMVMPFVTVTSKGGPHDDNSYVAGYIMGTLDMTLKMASSLEAVFKATIEDVNMPQVDLLAMRYGYKMTIEPVEDSPGWNLVTFERGSSL
jgi:hypothetical protein